jgi:hypothetical protein
MTTNLKCTQLATTFHLGFFSPARSPQPPTAMRKRPAPDSGGEKVAIDEPRRLRARKVTSYYPEDAASVQIQKEAASGTAEHVPDAQGAQPIKKRSRVAARKPVANSPDRSGSSLTPITESSELSSVAATPLSPPTSVTADESLICQASAIETSVPVRTIQKPVSAASTPAIERMSVPSTSTFSTEATTQPPSPAQSTTVGKPKVKAGTPAVISVTSASPPSTEDAASPPSPAQSTTVGRAQPKRPTRSSARNAAHPTPEKLGIEQEANTSAASLPTPEKSMSTELPTPEKSGSEKTPETKRLTRAAARTKPSPTTATTGINLTPTTAYAGINRTPTNAAVRKKRSLTTGTTGINLTPSTAAPTSPTTSSSAAPTTTTTGAAPSSDDDHKHVYRLLRGAHELGTYASASLANAAAREEIGPRQPNYRQYVEYLSDDGCLSVEVEVNENEIARVRVIKVDVDEERGDVWVVIGLDGNIVDIHWSQAAAQKKVEMEMREGREASMERRRLMA